MTDQMKAAVVFVAVFLAIVIGLTFYTMKKSKSITEKSIAVRIEAVEVQKETNRLLKQIIRLMSEKSKRP